MAVKVHSLHVYTRYGWEHKKKKYACKHAMGPELMEGYIFVEYLEDEMIYLA